MPAAGMLVGSMGEINFCLISVKAVFLVFNWDLTYNSSIN